MAPGRPGCASFPSRRGRVKEKDRNCLYTYIFVVYRHNLKGRGFTESKEAHGNRIVSRERETKPQRGRGAYCPLPSLRLAIAVFVSAVTQLLQLAFVLSHSSLSPSVFHLSPLSWCSSALSCIRQVLHDSLGYCEFCARSPNRNLRVFHQDLIRS